MTDDELIALAEHLSSGITFDGGFNTPPIMGTVWDQVSPTGVQNPYWEVVRRMPTRKDWHGAGRDPEGYWIGDVQVIRRSHDAGLDRHSLCARYAWSVPSPGSVAWIANLVADRGVVEIGAGSGYWAWQLSQAGVDVVAYDPNPAGEDNNFAKHGPYHPVHVGDQSAAADHGERVLMLCWPSYGADFAEQAVRAYPGDLLVYIGEGWGGCCADGGFFKLLDDGWDEIGSCPLHVTYSGIHCRLSAYSRRTSTGQGS
jgi:hypothetical protein